MTNLANQKVLSHEEMVALKSEEIQKYLSELKEGWVLDGSKITKEFKFEDFVKAMDFVNKVAGIAEEKGHHPDIAIHYNKVEITLWSHLSNGLSIIDFIVAANIDTLL